MGWSKYVSVAVWQLVVFAGVIPQNGAPRPYPPEKQKFRVRWKLAATMGSRANGTKALQNRIVNCHLVPSRTLIGLRRRRGILSFRGYTYRTFGYFLNL
ncbi:uncharacterized protein EI90DRAFT_3069939 [Cantharellus anzutake]|uniref:uncharacterized protein n=1 Tax=Cantharellus anzutake TaxID=1750568 RepID=UPI001908FFAF|nr:uncharacterized protein EI90DRAFT_3069939 [Cantharellus anzutake]KAF8326617.1 hypothetical protein EI90DRAFT_3069939 [Cantharellus anzutake]